MNPYTLTLLRHGDIDHQQRLIGSSDLPLTERGVADMNNSWQRILRHAPVTSMACSPLLRCREFAVTQALACRVPLQVEPLLAECHFGAWEQRLLSDIAATTPDWQTLLARGLLTPEGGESFEYFRTRVLAGFSSWMQQARGSHRVLISHGGVINVLLAELLGTDFNVARLMAVQRGGFAQLSILDGHPAYLTRLEAPDTPTV